MAKYRAKADLYVADVLIKSGTEFTSNDVPGKNWEPLDAAAKATSTARFGEPPVPATHAAPVIVDPKAKPEPEPRRAPPIHRPAPKADAE